MIIKFNLLPKVEIEIKETKEKSLIFLKTYFSIISFLLLTITFIVYNLSKQVNSLESEKKMKEETLKQYKHISNKVKDLEKRSIEVKKRIEVIIALKEKQGKNLMKMDLIFQASKENSVFFNNFTLNSTTAQIKGLSYDLDILANYMKNLELNRNIIKSLNLKMAQRKHIGLLKIVEFDLEVNF